MSEEKIRCYRDQTVMVPIPGRPGWIHCPTCRFVTTLIGYGEDEVARMVRAWFEGKDENEPELGDEGADDGALALKDGKCIAIDDGEYVTFLVFDVSETEVE